jgi:hypothetical protein
MKSNELKCPNCKLINSPTALRCDCGYEFMFNILNRVTDSPAQDTVSGTNLQTRLTTKVQPSAPTDDATLLSRYRDGYRIARWMVRSGKVIPAVGMTFGILGGVLLGLATAGLQFQHFADRRVAFV